MHLQLLFHDPDNVSLLQRRGPTSEHRRAVRRQLQEVLLKVGPLVEDVDEGLAVDDQRTFLLLQQAGSLELVAGMGEIVVIKCLYS